MDKNGNITGAYTSSANHNADFPRAFAFVSGQEPGDDYYKDLVEFQHVLDVLGVDLWEEDARMFDEAFMDKLVVDYIIKNHEFFSRNPAVLNGLRTARIEDFHPEVVQSQTITKVSPSSLVQMIISSEVGRQHLGRACNPDLIDKFIMQMYMQGNKHVSITIRQYKRATGHGHRFSSLKPDDRVPCTYESMELYNGFLCLYGSSEPVVFNVSSIYHQSDAYAILHASGTLFLIMYQNNTAVLNIEDAMDFLDHMRHYGKNAESVPLASGRKLKEWDVCAL